jgi:hypothetical protein
VFACFGQFKKTCKVQEISNFQELLKVQSSSDYRQIKAKGSDIGKLSEIWRVFKSNDSLRKTFFESQGN